MSRKDFLPKKRNREGSKGKTQTKRMQRPQISYGVEGGGKIGKWQSLIDLKEGGWLKDGRDWEGPVAFSLKIII